MFTQKLLIHKIALSFLHFTNDGLRLRELQPFPTMMWPSRSPCRPGDPPQRADGPPKLQALRGEGRAHVTRGGRVAALPFSREAALSAGPDTYMTWMPSMSWERVTQISWETQAQARAPRSSGGRAVGREVS